MTKLFHFRFAIFTLLMQLIAPALHAHQLDEYFQSTLVSIDQNKITLAVNLSPGVSIAGKVLPRLDTNRDGVISTIEAKAYCEDFKNDLTIGIDGHRVSLKLEDYNVPDYADLTNGLEIMQVIYSAETPLGLGEHKLTFENHHMLSVATYLFNAAPPQSRFIQIVSQNRNQTQSTATISFKVEPTAARKTITLISMIGLWIAMFAGVWRVRTKNAKTKQ